MKCVFFFVFLLFMQQISDSQLILNKKNKNTLVLRPEIMQQAASLSCQILVRHFWSISVTTKFRWMIGGGRTLVLSTFQLSLLPVIGWITAVIYAKHACHSQTVLLGLLSHRWPHSWCPAEKISAELTSGRGISLLGHPSFNCQRTSEWLKYKKRRNISAKVLSSECCTYETIMSLSDPHPHPGCLSWR